MNGRTNVNIRNTDYQTGTAVVGNTLVSEILPADYGLDYFDRVQVTINFEERLLGICLGHTFDFTSVEMGNTLTEIPNYLLYGTAPVRRVDVPTSVVSIGNQAFRYTGMTSLRVGSAALTSIGDYCFANNTSLTSAVIDMPNVNVTTHMLYGCTHLNDLTILHLPVLSTQAMQDVSRLTYVQLPADLISIGDNCFDLSNNEYYNATTPLHIVFNRHGQWDASGNTITAITAMGNRIFGQRAPERTVVHVPLDSIRGYRDVMNVNRYNRNMLNVMRAFYDRNAGDSLPAQVVQRVGNVVGTYQLSWYSTRFCQNAEAVTGGIAPATGRYYATITVVSEETIEEE